MAILTGIGLGLAQLPGAIGKGLEGRQRLKDAETARNEGREDAKYRKKVRDSQLAQIGREDALADKTQDVKEMQLNQLLDDNKKLKRKTLRSDSHQSLDRFFQSAGSPRHFNKFLSDNPEARSLFGDIVRVDQLNLAAEGDRNLIRSQLKVSDEELDRYDGKDDGRIDWTALTTRYVRATDSQGKTRITDIFKTAVEMGYADYADDKNLARLKRLADIRKLTQTDKKVTPTAESRNAQQLGVARTNVESGNATATDKAFIDVMGTKLTGTQGGRRNEAEQAITEWASKGYDKLSQEQLLHGKDSADSRRVLRKIEAAYGMSEADQKLLTVLSKVSSISNTAAKLGDKETGIIDSLVSSFSSYTNDDTTTKEAKMAYGALMNSVRHSLFGSAQTDGELKLFRQAYGTLGNQSGTVLAGLSQALQQIKAQYQTIADRYPEAIVQGRIGRSKAEMSAAVEQLDKRISFYNLVAKGIEPDDAHAQVFGKQEIATGTEQEVTDIAAELGL